MRAPQDYSVGSAVELRNARDSGTAVEVLGADGKRDARASPKPPSAQSFTLPA